MSAAITTGSDLLASMTLPKLPALFTTFATSHFVKPCPPTQPVAVKAPTVLCYSEVYVAAPLDLDYDEPNAVLEQELEIVAAGQSVHHLEVAVTKPAEVIVDVRREATRVAA